MRVTARYAASVEVEIAALLDRFAADFDAGFHLSPFGNTVFVQLREYALRPGKRLRGCLAAAAYDSAAGTDAGRPGIVLGAALELLHSYLLIVDDVMDSTAVRRGGPALQRQYMHGQRGNMSAHSADMLAVCAGLVVQHAANAALLELPVPAGHIAAALTAIHRNFVATGFGQMDDLAQRGSAAPDEQSILRTLRLKTSYYTVVGPIQAGFSLAGRTEAQTLQAVQRFGEAAGTAFQLQDDYLDVFGTPAVLGKQPGGDLRDGTSTLLLHYAMARAAPQQRETLQRIVGKRRAGKADICAARDIMVATGAAAAVQHTAREYAAQARQELADGAFGAGDLRNILGELLDFIVQPGA